jgi:hypothetical protein
MKAILDTLLMILTFTVHMAKRGRATIRTHGYSKLKFVDRSQNFVFRYIIRRCKVLE